MFVFILINNIIMIPILIHEKIKIVKFNPDNPKLFWFINESIKYKIDNINIEFNPLLTIFNFFKYSFFRSSEVISFKEACRFLFLN